MRRFLNGRGRDAAVIALLFFLPLIAFWAQTVGGRTLLPTENLYQYEPYATYREVVRAPEVPHNALVSDLVLQNMQFKAFIREQIAQGEIPLWNPHQFSGIAFFAAGQQSTLYPFSILFYVLPLTAAYGWFTVLQLWLAGAFMYAFLRGLGVSRGGAAAGGVVYQLAANMIVSAVFPMILAAAVWLPLILLMIEFTIRQQPALRGRPTRVLWIAIGAGALGCVLLAGHAEFVIYTLLVSACYTAARLIHLLITERGHNLRMVITHGLSVIALTALGIGLGAVQFLPLFEAAADNYRTEAPTLEQVLDWGHPARDFVLFFMPNFYGSPAHHGYTDVFTGETVSLIDSDVTTINGNRLITIDWGDKNYVEGALYVGILPLALSAYALFHAFVLRKNRAGERHQLAIFALLGIVSLTFMFGLPTYALLYYGVPGMAQLHSPFRWVFVLTLCIAVLTGFGLDALIHTATVWKRRFGVGLIAAGVIVIVGTIGARFAFPQIAPTIDNALRSLALADRAFSDAAMFFSYQLPNVIIFGMMLIASGVVFFLASWKHAVGVWRAKPLHDPTNSNEVRSAWDVSSPSPNSGRGLGGRVAFVAVIVIAADLLIATWGFNPASDPALLDFTPPAIEWLQGQPGEFRYTVIDDGRALLNANMTMRYGLDDVRGYESIIPLGYVDYMQGVAPQTQLDFNRIAPLYTDSLDQVDWDRLSRLNVCYIVTPVNMGLPESFTTRRDGRTGTLLQRRPVYQDEAVKIWANGCMPRAQVLNVPNGETPQSGEVYGSGFNAVIEHHTTREKVVHTNLYADTDTWLVISENYASGWRAYVRPRGGSDDTERELPVEPVFDILQGVNLSPDVLAATFPDADELPPEQQNTLENRQVTVRLVYSPASFQIGAFISFISGVIVVFMLGVWLWRLFVAREAAGASVIARNSAAPILLNLFNRGIDFAFAFVMLRILGPADAGLYFYAGIVFVWFDIFTNFGLNLYLTREVARDRSKARHLFVNTSAMRVGLAGVGVPLLIAFLAARNTAVEPALDSTAMVAIFLLYLGLLPNSLSTGMTALFYAFERAEIPAAVTTVATINKAVFGLLALIAGWGIVGLAAVSIVTNVVTFALLMWQGRGMITPPPTTFGRHPLPEFGEGESPSPDISETQPMISHAEATNWANVDRKLPSPNSGRGWGWGRLWGEGLRLDFPLIRRMAGESFPLMLNHFLATIFFQIDVVIIEAIHGARMVGQYSVAYKWISALNIIPAFFTQALLPLMSRQAHEDPAALKRNYALAIKLLVSVALPVAVAFTFMAEWLTSLLGGSQYLPDGAIATQLMIWSIPIGWINSLTQYVLIALDLQIRITRAFVVAVLFNIITNLLFVPQYGYRAAALTTIASEAVLLIPFGLLLHHALGRIDWIGLLARPVIAAAAMLGVLLVGWSVQPVVALVFSGVVYIAVLLALRPFSPEEWARLPFGGVITRLRLRT